MILPASMYKLKKHSALFAYQKHYKQHDPSNYEQYKYHSTEDKFSRPLYLKFFNNA